MNLVQEISEMQRLAERLIPCSYPLGSLQDEETVSCLKQRTLAVDGYEVVAYFSRSRSAQLTLSTLQVYGCYFSFLPFSLVCKLAFLFLGDQELALGERLHRQQPKEAVDVSMRKIYIWTVHYNIRGEPVPSPFVKAGMSQLCSFEGLPYRLIDPQHVTLF